MVINSIFLHIPSLFAEIRWNPVDFLADFDVLRKSSVAVGNHRASVKLSHIKYFRDSRGYKIKPDI